MDKKEIVIDLPFDQSKNRVVIAQGFNSPFSHKPASVFDLTYSVDFALPIGTPVTAVQDGVVKRVMKDRDCYRGFDPAIGRRNWASSVEITSPDDSAIFSMLQHLDPDSILVTDGQRVVRGQVLAKTGLTGWVGPIPHLHVSMVDSMKRPLQTIPFRFRNYSRSLLDNYVDSNLFVEGSRLAHLILDEREKADQIMNGSGF